MIVNDEFGGVWKEMVAIDFKLLYQNYSRKMFRNLFSSTTQSNSGIFLEELRKNTKTPVRIAGLPA